VTKNQRHHARACSGHDALEPNYVGTAKNLFIIFVDAIFTTLFERPFTNAFEVMAQTPAPACVYPARTTG
jgi:hypothetical protein